MQGEPCHPRQPHNALRSADAFLDRLPLRHQSRYFGTNGLIFDSDGVLYACEGGARRVVRYEPDGSTTVLADGFEGSKLNIPNDLAIDLRGRVWFTDPYYERAGGPWSEDCANKELDHDSVYRQDPRDDGWSSARSPNHRGRALK